jgi:hypothetical protein
MNSRAAMSETKRHIAKQLANPASVECDMCSEPSAEVSEWFDIFSDDAKGVTGLCQRHYDDYGPGGESHFLCCECDRLFVNNYTWESYFVGEDGDYKCLNCARKAYLADDDHWIASGTPIKMAMVNASPHLIAAGQTTPSDLKFLGNAEFDSMTGKGIYGQNGMGQIAEARAKADGKPVVLILDAAYQFAVSVGVYIKKESE